MKATQKLTNRMKSNGVNWSAIDASPDPANLIELKSNKNESNKRVRLGFKDIDYERIPEMRDAVLRINKELKGTLVNLKITDERRQMVDFTNRYLARKFTNGSFEAGGRFYGGWWIDIPREYRKYIQIKGKPTAELDYSTLHPTILYLKKGLLPLKDSYRLDGWDIDHHDVYKKTFNQLLNSKPKMQKKTMWGSFAPELLKSDNAPGWHHLSQSDRIRINREKFIRLTGRDYDDLIEAIRTDRGCERDGKLFPLCL
jgi:hypothetical protein